MNTDAVIPLRHRMIEDMNARKLSAARNGAIFAAANGLLRFSIAPDTTTSEDIRRFQLHLADAGVSICNRNRMMTRLRFLFRVTLRRLDLAAEIYHIREPQKIPLVMSPDETRRLLAVASNLKVRTLLRLGLRLRPACQRGDEAEGQAYRQRAEDHSGRAVQRPKGPQCHAVTRDARSVAPMVEGASIALRCWNTCG
jgi:hypothetical protein